MDYEVQHSARRCSTTGREFAPGETYYSVLMAEGAEVEAATTTPPTPGKGRRENAVGWWKSQIPDRTEGRKHWAPNDVMLQFWDELADQPERQDMRYVLTLLLIRRRVFRLEEEKSDDKGGKCWWPIVRAAKPPTRCRRHARAGADRRDPRGVGGAVAVEGGTRG